MESTFRLPALIALDLKVNIGRLVFEDFVAEDISGAVRLNDQVLEVAPIALRSANGTVSGSLLLDGRPDGAYPLNIAAQVKADILQKLFANQLRSLGETQVVTLGNAW